MYPSYEPAHSPPRGPSSSTRWMALLLLAVAGALIFTVLRGRTERGVDPSSTGASTTPVVARAITPRGDLASDEQSTIELFRSASPAVVHVTNVVERRERLSLNVYEIPQGTGSGFVWDDQGHIVTNYHVIHVVPRLEPLRHLEVALAGSDPKNGLFDAQVVGFEVEKDTPSSRSRRRRASCRRSRSAAPPTCWSASRSTRSATPSAWTRR